MIEETGHVVENKHNVAVVFNLGETADLVELLGVNVLDLLGLRLGELLVYVSKVGHLTLGGADGAELGGGGLFEGGEFFAQLGLLGGERAGELVELVPLFLNLLERTGQVVSVLLEALELNKNW